MMTTRSYTKKGTERGFTLFVAVITASIVLAMGMSILNVTLKEFILSGVARDSEMAFYAADAGMECAQYWDDSLSGGKFDIGATPTAINCMGVNPRPTPNYSGTINDGETGEFSFEWDGGSGTPRVCAVIEVTKYTNATDASCPSGGVVCTEIRSSGYNRACGNLSGPRTVERTLRSRY